MLAPSMTYTVSGGALNSTQSNLPLWAGARRQCQGAPVIIIMIRQFIRRRNMSVRSLQGRSYATAVV